MTKYSKDELDLAWYKYDMAHDKLLELIAKLDSEVVAALKKRDLEVTAAQKHVDELWRQAEEIQDTIDEENKNWGL